MSSVYSFRLKSVAMAPEQHLERARYSIRLAARMSGISAHTLRMWERRYGFPVPLRTEGGARRYTEDDVATLKLISQALELGYRAGDVVGKPPDNLRRMIAEQKPSAVATPAAGEPPQIDKVLAALARDDLGSVREQLRHAVAALGPKRFLTHFAQPLAHEVGERWARGELAVRQEHAVSDLLTTQIRTLVAGFELPDGRPRVLLTTLPDELHGLALDMVALFLALHQAGPRSLGISTPVHEIAQAAIALDVDVVGLSISGATPAATVAQAVSALLAELPRRVEVWVGGGGARSEELRTLEARTTASWEEVAREITRWRTQHGGRS